MHSCPVVCWLILLSLPLSAAEAERWAVVKGTDHLGVTSVQVMPVVDDRVVGAAEWLAQLKEAHATALAAWTASASDPKRGPQPKHPLVLPRLPYLFDRAKAEAIAAQLSGAGKEDSTSVKTVVPGGTWRPFSDNSPWNTPIPKQAELDPRSAEFAAQLADSCPKWPFMSLNKDGYSIPVQFVDASKTPLRKVLGLPGREEHRDQRSRQPAPIPDDARPSVGSDAHLCVVDVQRGLCWDYWSVMRLDHREFAVAPWDWSETSWGVGSAYVIDLRGSGVRPPAGTTPVWQESFCARASGFPLIAGLIRPEELAAGRIDHALILAYPRPRSRWFVPPASAYQGDAGEANGLLWATENVGLPMGARVQYDPTIQVDQLPVSVHAKTILRALQIYGAYIGDCSGAISICGDESARAKALWDELGVPHTVIKEATSPEVLKRMRVLKLPDSWYYLADGLKPRPAR